MRNANREHIFDYGIQPILPTSVTAELLQTVVPFYYSNSGLQDLILFIYSPAQVTCPLISKLWIIPNSFTTDHHGEAEQGFLHYS